MTVRVFDPEADGFTRFARPWYVRTMPRKAKADHLKVASLGRPRLEPPEVLDAAEARIWRSVVDAAPGGFLHSIAQLILRQVVCQRAVSDRHVEKLRALVAQPEDRIETELVLAEAHRRAMAAIITGMTTLRVTPPSRIRPRDAGRTFERLPAAGAKRPWDTRAPTHEAEPGDGDETA